VDKLIEFEHTTLDPEGIPFEVLLGHAAISTAISLRLLRSQLNTLTSQDGAYLDVRLHNV
jgi:hypothetical protein